MQPAPRKLLDQAHDAIRLKHYVYTTGQTHIRWIKRFILFHDERHPQDMGRTQVEAFLTHLGVETERTLWERVLECPDSTCLVVSHRRPALQRTDDLDIPKHALQTHQGATADLG